MPRRKNRRTKDRKKPQANTRFVSRRIPHPGESGLNRGEAKQRVRDWANLTRITPLTNPVVNEIKGLFQAAIKASRLNPYVVLTDWASMMEAGLRFQAENLRSIAYTGEFYQDPPEVALIFKQARERFLRASEKNPTAYQKMQDAFGKSFALLQMAAEPGLEHYTIFVKYSPDVIGEVFQACLMPGVLWKTFFPPWDVALASARYLYPDAEERVHEELGRAAVYASQDGVTVPRLVPGENWEEWFDVIYPYIVPLIISTPIDSSTMMLAIAAQFPDWAVQRNLVRFSWSNLENLAPVLKSMTNINAMLYRLNGYYLEQVVAHNEIHQAILDDRTVLTRPQPIEAIAPEVIYHQLEDGEDVAATEEDDDGEQVRAAAHSVFENFNIQKPPTSPSSQSQTKVKTLQELFG